MDQLIEINSLEEYEKAIQTKSIILFTASWCPDCMFIKPFIGNVVKKYPNFTFYSINRDYFIDLCQDLDILGIPSFVSYENGQETGRLNKEEMKSFLNHLFMTKNLKKKKLLKKVKVNKYQKKLLPKMLKRLKKK